MRLVWTSVSAFCVLVSILNGQALGGGSLEAKAKHKIKIGFSMDTLKEGRWMRDRDLFVKHAQDLGAEVLVQAANGNEALQLSQAENLLTQGVDVLVVVPYNGMATAAIVKAAHKLGKKVIAYDRMIENADVDFYLSFDNVEVGRMQARFALAHVPKGNYMILGGAPTDNNAKMFRQGEMEILKPSVDKGDIKIVADPWAKAWMASEALKHTENALSRNQNNIQAIVAANDGTAGGAIAALKQQKLVGKILVTGQDADLIAIQRIVDGSQSMTIYKPIKQLAEKAVEAALLLAKGESFKETLTTVDNGYKKVPSLLLTPYLVDRANIESTVIKDGFHSREDIYKNIASAQKERF